MEVLTTEHDDTMQNIKEAPAPYQHALEKAWKNSRQIGLYDMMDDIGNYECDTNERQKEASDECDHIKTRGTSAENLNETKAKKRPQKSAREEVMYSVDHNGSGMRVIEEKKTGKQKKSLSEPF